MPCLLNYETGYLVSPFGGTFNVPTRVIRSISGLLLSKHFPKDYSEAIAKESSKIGVYCSK
jgi:hypothetical protein